LKGKEKMAAMDKMLADMLKRLIPQEVLDLLTPEKVKEVTEGIRAYILYQHEFMDRTDLVLDALAIVPEKNKASFEKVFAILADMQQQIEELKNERGTGSGSDSNSKRGRRSDSGSGGLAGNANGASTGDS
jgi:hypothetical protein